MKFFKNASGDLFVDPILDNHGELTEVTKAEFDTLVTEEKPLTEPERLAALKSNLEKTLSMLTHDFGDGRIIQVRPEDEPNFVRAYRLLAITETTEIKWKMADNLFYIVTGDELREAQDSGIMQGAGLWAQYEIDSAPQVVE